MLLNKFILRINRSLYVKVDVSLRSGYKNSLLKFKIMEVNGQFHSQAAISLRKELTQQWIRGWIGPTAGGDVAMKRNILPLPGIDTWLRSQEPVPLLRQLTLLGDFRYLPCACKMPLKQFCSLNNVKKSTCLTVNKIKYRFSTKYLYLKFRH